MIQKLKRIGIDGDFLKLLANYLTNRKQFVKINEINSNLENVTCGIPQGSILGPTLFLIYVEDIFELKLYGQIQLFADDTALTYGCKTSQELKTQMESDLVTISNWLNLNHLKLNSKKTIFIQFQLKSNNGSPDNSLQELVLGSEVIKRVDKTTYLGLQISAHLNWTNHVNHVKQKIAPVVGVFRRISKYVPSDYLMNFYMSYIQSHLIYLLPIWGGANITKLSELKILQNKALKALFRLPNDFSTKRLYSKEILPIEKLVEYEYTLLIFKIHNNLIRINDCGLTQTNISITNRTTRSSQHIHLPKFTNNVSMKSVFFEGVKLFNALPVEWKTYKIGKFKNELKTKLFNEFISNN